MPSHPVTASRVSRGRKSPDSIPCSNTASARRSYARRRCRNVSAFLPALRTYRTRTIAAIAAWDGFWTLDAPVMRLAPPATPSPYAPNLEKQWLPGRAGIERAIERPVRI